PPARRATESPATRQAVSVFRLRQNRGSTRHGPGSPRWICAIWPTQDVSFGSLVCLARRSPARQKSLKVQTELLRRANWLDLSSLRPADSLYDLVSAAQNRLWKCKAEGPGGLQIDDQLEPGRLLNGQIGRADALQDLVDVGRKAPEGFLQIGAVG